ncbi:hypothetical protein K8B33_14915 [Alcanivorax sp. JB21]|uniref:hypothetical protein n=1 Tax=Alcanivorax limicola TaxID=2874102 RepID=UPI001CBCBAEF|nr:hypothetical protein [Alcanivorax limicola]MBZ2190399.1 hypothetical protein [Alcanivorax limicola]
MRRIYFLLPDVTAAANLVKDFRQQGIKEEQMHLVARHDMPLGDLPEADTLEKSDLGPALKRGAALGGSAGLLAGLTAMAIPTAGVALGGAAVLGIALAGTGFGAWASAMLGASVPDEEIEASEAAIKQGNVLMMVDASHDQIDALRAFVRQRHPDTDIRDTESTAPPLPDVDLGAEHGRR